MYRSIPAVLLLASLLLTAGCSGAGRATYDAPEEAYEKGMQAFEQGRYERAVEYFRGAFDFGRTHEFADDAQFYLGRAYYEDGQYILAASEFSRFAQLYRADERVPEAERPMLKEALTRAPDLRASAPPA